MEISSSSLEAEQDHTGRVLSVDDTRVRQLLAKLMHMAGETGESLLPHVAPGEEAWEIAKAAALWPGILNEEGADLDAVALLIDTNAEQTAVHESPSDPHD